VFFCIEKGISTLFGGFRKSSDLFFTVFGVFSQELAKGCFLGFLRGVILRIVSQKTGLGVFLVFLTLLKV